MGGLKTKSFCVRAYAVEAVEPGVTKVGIPAGNTPVGPDFTLNGNTVTSHHWDMAACSTHTQVQMQRSTVSERTKGKPKGKPRTGNNTSNAHQR